ncbi:uncharacterized protein LOC119653017 [Hermetia illucens]|uniref:uncharacterized protein LOC119653017 n=1 Tax=Hermetia illucens TaxID=343691 RepID=UPI0018CC5457|nr:uncharacterized protein LOC119653017 [Hermetia illucens]
MGNIYNWLFGLMSDSDRQHIEEHSNTIDSNNHEIIDRINKQIQINNKLEQNIQNITQLIKANAKVLDTNIAYLSLIFNIHLLQDQIEIIQDNLISARLGIMNRHILTKDEILQNKINIHQLEHIELAVLTNTRNNQEIIFVIRLQEDLIITPRYYVIPIPDKDQYQINFEPQTIVKINGIAYDSYNENHVKHLKANQLCIYVNRVCNKEKVTTNLIKEIETELVITINAVRNWNSTCDERAAA